MCVYARERGYRASKGSFGFIVPLLKLFIRRAPFGGGTDGYESRGEASNKVTKGGLSLYFMAAGDGAQLPATITASRSVEKALEEAAASGALNLSNRKLKEFPRTARNYDLSDITHAGELCFFPVCLVF